MKKHILFISVILIITVLLSGCVFQQKPDESTSPNISVIEPTSPTEITTIDTTESLKLPNEEKLVYNKNNIMITYTGQDFGVNNYDEYHFVVKNDSQKNIVFSISSVAINGSSTIASYFPKIIKTNTVSDVTIRTRTDTRFEICNDENDIACLQFVGFIVEKNNVDDTKCESLIEDNINFEITADNHSHSEDKPIIKGNLVYENEEVVVYINPQPVDTYPYNYFAYSIINKTNKNIFITFDNVELQTIYMSEFTMPSNTFDVFDFIPSNCFATGTFYLDNTRGQQIKQMKMLIDAEEKTAMTTFTELPITKKPLKCNDAPFEIKVKLPETPTT